MSSSRFDCQNCRMRYRVLRIEEETVQVTHTMCPNCGGVLHGRKGILKYLLDALPSIAQAVD